MVAYERVRRNCVFAHDELVIKIALACNTLSAGMASAALDELRIVSAEKSVGGDWKMET